jgi:hypothetical protein
MVFGTPSTAARKTASSYNRAADPALKTLRSENTACGRQLERCTIPKDTTDLVGQGTVLEKRGGDDRPDGVSFASYAASSSLRTAAI